jgi:hypothetical protein
VNLDLRQADAARCTRHAPRDADPHAEREEYGRGAQPHAEREGYGELPPTPVLYITQLLGLALGLPTGELGLKALSVSADPLLHACYGGGCGCGSSCDCGETS